MRVDKELSKGSHELILLKLLSRQDMYGYQLTQTPAERSGGQFIIKEGSMYPTLYRLLGKGLISDYQKKVGARRTRVYYHLEPEGDAYLGEIRKEYISLNQGGLRVLGYNGLEELAK